MSSASFRDPAGCCFALDHRVLRLVNNGSIPEVESFLASATVSALFKQEQLIPTRRLNAADLFPLAASPEWNEMVAGRQFGLVLEHERVAFPSFPHEWPAEMLCA